MDGNNEDKKYDLYTEHIMPESGKKIRRVLKKMLMVLAMAVLFGLVAGLVMIIVYRAGSRFFPEQESKQEVTLAQVTTSETRQEETQEETTPHETVTIPSPETSSKEPEQTTETEEGETIPGIADIERIHEAYKAVAARIDAASVTVAVAEAGVEWFDTVYQNVSYEYGLIVAADSESYYILTDYRALADKAQLSVTYPDKTVKNAERVMGDSVLGMAVIKTEIVNNENISPATFGNSSLLSQGDVLIAVGKIYGYTGTVGYGIAAGVDKVLSNTDSEFAVINTNIAADSNASGVLCNLSGEVVGIITSGYNGSGSFVNAYAISGMHRQIERLINAKQKAFLGVKGQSVTDSIQELHKIPEGIYVSAVEVNSPAHNSGIQTGDVITAIGGEVITDMGQFMNALSKYAPGDNIEVTVKRRGRDSYKEIVFRVTLGVQ